MYSTCSTYKDLGEARQIGAGHRSSISFETSFVRPAQLMFTWSGEAWQKKFARKSWSFDGVKVTDLNSRFSLNDILNSDSIESTGLTGIVFHLLEPCFLNSELKPSLNLSELKQSKIVDRCHVRGDECSVIETKNTCLWIRMRDFAILKVRLSSSLLAKDKSSFESMFPKAVERFGTSLTLELSTKWKQDAVFIREFDFNSVIFG